MEAIAKEAGVGVGTLYRHFPKRIDVVEAVYREDVDELVSAAEAVSRRPGAVARLVAWLEAFVRYASGKRRFLNELHEAFEKNPELRVGLAGAHRRGAEHRARPGPRTPAWSAPTSTGPTSCSCSGSMCMSATLTPDQSARLLVMIEDGLRPQA